MAKNNKSTNRLKNSFDNIGKRVKAACAGVLLGASVLIAGTALHGELSQQTQSEAQSSIGDIDVNFNNLTNDINKLRESFGTSYKSSSEYQESDDKYRRGGDADGTLNTDYRYSAQIDETSVNSTQQNTVDSYKVIDEMSGIRNPETISDSFYDVGDFEKYGYENMPMSSGVGSMSNSGVYSIPEHMMPIMNNNVEESHDYEMPIPNGVEDGMYAESFGPIDSSGMGNQNVIDREMNMHSKNEDERMSYDSGNDRERRPVTDTASSKNSSVNTEKKENNDNLELANMEANIFFMYSMPSADELMDEQENVYNPMFNYLLEKGVPAKEASIIVGADRIGDFCNKSFVKIKETVDETLSSLSNTAEDEVDDEVDQDFVSAFGGSLYDNLIRIADKGKEMQSIKEKKLKAYGLNMTDYNNQKNSIIESLNEEENQNDR